MDRHQFRPIRGIGRSSHTTEDLGRDLPVPKRLYVVHNGAIYEAQTSDHGRSYHGYPYKGKLSPSILRKLAEMARKKHCTDRFDKWVGEYIERHGA